MSKNDAPLDVNHLNPPVIIDEAAHSRPTLLGHNRRHSINGPFPSDVSPAPIAQEQHELNQHYQKQKKGWNTFLSVYAKRIGQRAGGFKWMHGQASQYYERLYQIIGIVCIAATVVATAGDIPSIANCQQDVNGIKIAAVVLQALTAFVMAFQQWKTYGGRSEKHVNYEASFAALYDQIKTQLQKNSKNRQDANDYIEMITEQFRSLKESSPAIPHWIWKRYRNQIAGMNIADPDGVDEIVIKRDSPIVSRKHLIPPPQLRTEFEVVVDRPAPGTESNPRFGLLTSEEELAYTRPKNFEANLSAKDRIALERWNDQASQ